MQEEKKKHSKKLLTAGVIIFFIFSILVSFVAGSYVGNKRGIQTASKAWSNAKMAIHKVSYENGNPVNTTEYCYPFMHNFECNQVVEDNIKAVIAYSVDYMVKYANEHPKVVVKQIPAPSFTPFQLPTTKRTNCNVRQDILYGGVSVNCTEN